MHGKKICKSRFKQFTLAPFYAFETGRFLKTGRQWAPQWKWYCATNNEESTGNFTTNCPIKRCQFVAHKVSKYNEPSRSRIPTSTIIFQAKNRLQQCRWLIYFSGHLFQFLGPDDLVRVSAVSFTWWRNVFQGCKSTAKMLLECEGIDLAEMGNLYQKVPLQFFALKKMINLKGTSISPKDFLKLVAVAKELRILNLESCMQITERSIFQAKPLLCFLRKVNVSHNKQLSVLSVACLCSYQSLQAICGRGLTLDENELLFLVKTFPQLANGQLDLETNTAGSDYFFDAVECVADFEIFEDLFWK